MQKYINVFSSFSVSDIEKAEKFYTEILGLHVKKNQMGFLDLHLSDNQIILIYSKGEAHKPADYTVLNLFVEDIDRAVDDLAGRGVKFEQYDGQIKTDEKGIARSTDPSKGPNIAWFKDPDGNIMSVIEDSTK